MKKKYEMQTPYFMIFEDKINNLLMELKDALNSNWSNYIIGYSFKTNALPWLIKHMKHQGCYAETVSKDEYQLAKRFGFKDKIIYNGPIKSRDTLIEAVRAGCIINIDSKRELRWLIEAEIQGKIGVRVNFDVEKFCPGETQCGAEGGRFGFCYENGELLSIINEIRMSNLSLVGLHMHCSSKTRSLGIYKAIAQMCCIIASEYKLELDYIDIGGGFFGGVDGKPSFNDYMKSVSNILGKQFNSTKTKLIIEPGMCLIGATVDYVTSVVDIKDTTYNRFVITDGSRTNIDPLMRKTNYTYRIECFDSKRKEYRRQIISGYTCMENDRILILENEKELAEGDKIIYEKVGAYTMCLTPLFIELFPDVYLNRNGKITKIRERWSVERLM